MVNSPVRISAPNFNIANRSAKTNTNAALANATASKKSGKFRAGASVAGRGKGSGEATIGLKFKHARKVKGKISVRFVVDFKDAVKISQLPGRVNAGISVLVNGTSSLVADERLQVLGTIENPVGGGTTLTSKTLTLMAKPGQQFEAVLVAYADAKAGDVEAKGKCMALAEGVLQSIEVRHL